MIKLILIILCFVVISGGFVCFCIVKASTPYDKEQDDLHNVFQSGLRTSYAVWKYFHMQHTEFLDPMYHHSV